MLPQPADWPANAEVVGFCTLEASERIQYQPPAELVEFLAAGRAPVYIGFGSMSLPKPKVCKAVPQPPGVPCLHAVQAWSVIGTGWVTGAAVLHSAGGAKGDIAHSKGTCGK